MRTSILLAAGLMLGAITLLSCGDASSPAARDPNGVAFSFVVVGCNRVDKADTSTLSNASTANVEELERTFADVAAISPKPKYFFFAGDEVFGFTADSVALANELTAWRAIYEASPLASSGIEPVTLPGNHEVQNAAKAAYPAAERTWLRVMAPYLTHAGDGPAAGGADKLATDQRRLSYSFDYQDTHFVLLNTDPVGADWHVPTNWVQSDIAAARSKGAKHVFVIGHKPAYPYPTAPTDGLSEDPAARDAFWNVLANNHVEAMFAAHNHVYYRAQPTGNTWMVVAGNGGSRLDSGLDPSIPSTGLYYGYTLVTVTNSGHVIVRSFGRDIPASYVAPVTAPTTLRDSLDATWK